MPFCTLMELQGFFVTCLFNVCLFRGNPGPSGAGACLLESDNNNFFWEGYKWLKNRTNTEAEYEGLILGLEAAREAGIRFLDIYGDSTAVIKQMRGASDVKSSVIVPYYERARELISDIPPPKFRCVAGKENSDADELANAAIDNRNNYSKWFN